MSSAAVPLSVQAIPLPTLSSRADPGYGVSAKVTAWALDPKIHPDPLTSYPDLVSYPGTASALNDTTVRDSTMHVPDYPGKPVRENLFAATVHNHATGSLFGYRTPRACSKVSRMVEDPLPQASVTLDTDVYHKVVSSAEYGYHKLDNDVLRKVEIPRGNTGNMNKVRAYGWQRYSNPAILPRNKRTLPFSVPAGIADNDDIRINSDRIKPILSANPNI